MKYELIFNKAKAHYDKNEYEMKSCKVLVDEASVMQGNTTINTW